MELPLCPRCGQECTSSDQANTYRCDACQVEIGPGFWRSWRWLPVDPANPTAGIRQSSNRQLTIELIKKKIAETTDEWFRGVLQEMLQKEIERNKS